MLAYCSCCTASAFPSQSPTVHLCYPRLFCHPVRHALHTCPGICLAANAAAAAAAAAAKWKALRAGSESCGHLDIVEQLVVVGPKA